MNSSSWQIRAKQIDFIDRRVRGSAHALVSAKQGQAVGYVLREEVHYCIASDQVALLDLRENCYLALPRKADVAFQKIAAGVSPATEDLDALAPLISAGLLLESSICDLSQRSVALIPATASFVDGPRNSLNWYATARSVFGLVKSELVLKTVPLAQTVEKIKRRKIRALTRGFRTDLVAIQQSALAFRDAGMFVAVQDRCLSRSLAFVSHLAARGQYPDLILGVKMRPFMAHAWVQQDEIVLNDTVDSVRGFTPILVV